MNKRNTFLVEVLTEELPPKALAKFGQAFQQQIIARLDKADLAFGDTQFFATPRRLAVLVQDLVAAQPDQSVERKGPALNVAFDANGKPSPACVGFARSCGVAPDQLTTLKTEQGEWVAYQQHVTGKSVFELLPALIEQAMLALPIPKRMRWGDSDVEFSRPIHSIIMLYGEKIVEGMVLGFPAGRETKGHRFHTTKALSIPRADDYVSILETKGHVIADFARRRALIKEKIEQCAAKIVTGAKAVVRPELLDEVTGLVEWPVAIHGGFEMAFLDVPKEALISAMEDHQRYFPIVDAHHKLLPFFITISNIESHDVNRVIHGNERVLRARLSDAAFFYTTDKKQTLAARIEQLKGIVFQAKLGTLYDKAERLAKLASVIAFALKVDEKQAERAGWLAKTDLMTNMVNEFPELQGIMGSYYAQQDGEPEPVAMALREHYLPRFAGDVLPQQGVGQVVALADRIDTLLGTFGVNQIPTGDKDPYGLRRAAVGIIRILIENKLNLDLKQILLAADKTYTCKLENPHRVEQVLAFIQERMRSWYQEQGVTADVFAAVAALGISNPLDVHARIKAVQAFKKLSEAETLSVANKRVSNILAKYAETLQAQKIDPSYFENSAEKELAHQLEVKSVVVERLSNAGQYEEVLFQLAELRQPIDNFFDQVMVMADDKATRENRLLMLSQLRALFLKVADIALLQ